MSYDSRIKGRIIIAPPLNGSEIRSMPNTRDIDICVEEHDVPVNGDIATVKVGIAIVPGDEEAFSRYTLHEQILALSCAIGNGHTFNGYLIRIGDESGDVERFSIVGPGEVISEQAELRWPDGKPVEGHER